MKAQIEKIFEYVKNNRKKVCIAGGAAILAVVVLILTIVLIHKRGTTASAGNVASSSEIANTSSANNEENSNSNKDEAVKTDENESESSSAKESIGDEITDTMPEDNADSGSGQNPITSSEGSYYGALKVSGTALTDMSGNTVQLKGISTHGIAWFPDYINNECFKELHESFGVNVIRLAMYTAEYNGYCTGGDKSYLKALVDNGVKYATENDMYAIIDWHILSDNNPNTYLSDAKEFFGEMSSKYAQNSNVIYEICNEPNGGTSWSEIKSYAIQIIEIIRQNDADAVIIVGTPNWSQYVEQAAADKITGYDNIMYALHFYAATHTDSLRNTMISALDSGLPIFVTEFGICDASGSGGIDEEQSAQWISLMNSRGISYAMWNLSNKNETSSIINSECNKVSGFVENDLSESGKWFLKMMTGGLSLPTINTTGENTDSSQNSNNSGNSSNNGQSNENSGNGENVDSGSSTSVNNVQVASTTKIVNSWQADGKTFYQCDITVTNNSGSACGSWSTDVIFNESVNLSDNWNGTFQAEGKKVHIVSTDYNGTLSNGASTGNIGMIISGSSNLKVSN